MFNPAVKGTKGGHFDGCSKSTGTEVIPGTVKIYDSWPFHGGDPWGFHDHKSKHCKHHISTTIGLPHIKLDGRNMLVTQLPGLSCGIPTLSPIHEAIIKP